MTRPLEEIEAEALRLPRQLRVLLADALIASLDDEENIEEAWRGVLSRRLAAGSVDGVSSERAYEKSQEIVSPPRFVWVTHGAASPPERFREDPEETTSDS